MKANSWSMVKLGDYVELLTGFPFKSAQYTDDPIGIRLLRGDNIAQGTLRWDGVKRWATSDIKQFSKYSLELDDVILAMDRPWIEAGLKWAFITKTDLPCLLVQRVARLRGKKGLLTKFLRYIIADYHFTAYVKGVLTGVNIPHISGSQIQAYQFCLPPIKAQEKIADILSAYDRLIENNTRRIKILEEMAQTLYREWFVNFRFPGHEQTKLVASELGLIPEGCKVTNLGKHIQTHKGYAFKSSWYQDSGVKLVKVSDFTDDSVDTSELVCIVEEIAQNYKKHELQVNDIIIQTVGSWPSNPQSVVGKVIRIPRQAAKSLLNQNAVKIIPKGLINQSFLYYLLKSEEFKKYIIGCAQGAASQASITLDSIREFNFLLPPAQLIELFHQVNCPTWELVNNLRDRNINLRQTRDLLLPKLISGEIDVENTAV